MDNNTLNLQMRQQPWYQAWFRSHGLDPNHVHLSDQQRQELAHLAASNGTPMTDKDIIDPAGNINTHHGFAGQPGWLKALEIGGVAGAGAIFGGPALMGLLAHGAPAIGASSGAGLTGTSIGSGMATVGPTSILGATGGGASLAGAGLTGAGLTGTAYGTGMATAAPSVASTAPSVGGGSIMSRLLGTGAKKLAGGGTDDHPGENFADAAAGLGAYAGAQANNRSEMANLGQNYDRTMLDAQTIRNQNESDALRKLGQTSYIQSGGAKPYTPFSFTTNGKTYGGPDLNSMAAQPSSDIEKQGAATLQDQLLNRLKPGGSYTPQDPSKYAHQGFGEKAANAGSLAASGLGFLRAFAGK